MGYKYIFKAKINGKCYVAFTYQTNNPIEALFYFIKVWIKYPIVDIELRRGHQDCNTCKWKSTHPIECTSTEVHSMTYKEFKSWCNDRACDGCWSLETLKLCVGAIKYIDQMKFWKREKEWQKINKEYDLISNIIIPTNKMIRNTVYGGNSE